MRRAYWLLVALALSLAGCEPPDITENSEGPDPLQYTAELIPGHAEWDASVTVTNTGQETVTFVNGCSPQLHILDGPEGEVLWAGAPPFVVCTLSRPTYTLGPGEAVGFIAHGPPYHVRTELGPGEYFVFVRVDLLEPDRSADIELGTVRLD